MKHDPFGRTILTFLVLATHLVSAATAYSCDDPPNHYPTPCKTVFRRFSAYISIADAKGFFKKHEVAVSFARIDEPQATKYLPEAGSAHITGGQAVRAFLEGVKVRIFATPISHVTLDLWVRPSFRSVQELKGKTVGVADPGFGYFVALETLLKGSGLRAEDVRKTPVGGFNDRLAAIQTGRLESALFPPTFEPALKQAALTKFETITIPFSRDVFVVPEKLFEDPRNKTFLVRFLRAIDDAVKFLKQNKDESIDIISKYSDLQRSAAESVYALYATAPEKPQSNIEAVSALLRDFRIAMPQQKMLEVLRPENIVTQEIVKAAFR